MLLGKKLEGFDEFWNQYPRHVAKKAAQKAWAKLNPSPELVQQMLTALAWQCELPQWQEGQQWVPHASTWLHNARWEDEPPTQAVERPRWSCPHVQHCSSREHCENATILGRPVKA